MRNLELDLRQLVSLGSTKSGKKAEVKVVDSAISPGAEVIEALSEKLLPDFHQGLVLFHPDWTQIKIQGISLYHYL